MVEVLSVVGGNILSVQDAQGEVRFFSPPPSPLRKPGSEQEAVGKSPFIIGVAGGTASGKVSSMICIVSLSLYLSEVGVASGKRVWWAIYGIMYPVCLCSQTSVCRGIVDQLGQTGVDSDQRRVVVISQDSFYRNLTTVEKILADQGEFNFDHPGQYWEGERVRKF